ncbi:MAG: RnfABCDGE type electron transport complex subunit D [Actinobacteria bacterium]|nr:RnfABCDGE type electron transport complex subunit D [Actinomycetota bacterium]MCL5888271.1 RnfABCDGE type electron transport complex subunit D [Actinomycetota bacterium]
MSADPGIRTWHVASSPHVAQAVSCPKIMFIVIATLLPVTIWVVMNMGMLAVGVLVACIASSVGSEALWNWIARKPQTITDGSALLTGLLLALTMPPRTPLWIAVAGGIVAICLGKMLFGGLGWNLFNPALVGKAFVAISWTGVLSEQTVPGGWYRGIDVPAPEGHDAITGATRLAIAAADKAASGAYGFESSQHYAPLLFRNLEGSLGEISAALLILGGFVLIAMRIIDWRIPTGYIGTAALLSWVLGVDPIFHVLAGGLLLGAFFMATDYVTSPMTKLGRLLFGCGCGLINIVARLYGPGPEATTWAILFMNGLVPLIDRLTAPRVFGWRKRNG